MVAFFGSGMVVADFRQDGMMDLDQDRLKIFVKNLESWLSHNFNTNRSSSFPQVHWPDRPHSCDYFKFSHIKAGNKTIMFLSKQGVNSLRFLDLL